MDLRRIFSHDVISDHKLVAVLAACVAEAESCMRSVRFKNKFYDLKPYEVLVDFGWVETVLELSKEEFLEKIEILEKLKRISAKINTDCIQIEFLNFSFPINPVPGHLSPDAGIIEISLKRWINIDLEYVKATYSDKYHELVGTSLRSLLKELGDVPLSRMTLSDGRLWVKTMQRRITNKDTPITNRAVNNYRGALQASFNRAVSEGYLKKNLFKEVRPLLEESKLPVIIERDEMTGIRDLLPRWARRTCDFLLMT